MFTQTIFFAGNISVLFATWNDVSIYFVSNVTSYPSFYFSQMLMLCKKEVTILHIHGKKSPSHKAIWLKFRISFTKFLRNLIMISICEKVRLQQLRKTKCSTLASILHIFLSFSFFTEPNSYLYNTMCTSHGFLISCFEFGNIFQKMWLLEKIHLVILL